jgi:hypothetical protein
MIRVWLKLLLAIAVADQSSTIDRYSHLQPADPRHVFYSVTYSVSLWIWITMRDNASAQAPVLGSTCVHRSTAHYAELCDQFSDDAWVRRLCALQDARPSARPSPPSDVQPPVDIAEQRAGKHRDPSNGLGQGNAQQLPHGARADGDTNDWTLDADDAERQAAWRERSSFAHDGCQQWQLASACQHHKCSPALANGGDACQLCRQCRRVTQQQPHLCTNDASSENRSAFDATLCRLCADSSHQCDLCESMCSAADCALRCVCTFGKPLFPGDDADDFAVSNPL